MRILAAVLGLTLLLLQYRLWISDHGTREVSRLQAAVDAQRNGDWAKYGEELKALGQILDRIGNK